MDPAKASANADRSHSQTDFEADSFLTDCGRHWNNPRILRLISSTHASRNSLAFNHEGSDFAVYFFTATFEVASVVGKLNKSVPCLAERRLSMPFHVRLLLLNVILVALLSGWCGTSDANRTISAIATPVHASRRSTAPARLPVATKEEVNFYPTYGYKDARGWNISLRGWVHEDGRGVDTLQSVFRDAVEEERITSKPALPIYLTRVRLSKGSSSSSTPIPKTSLMNLTEANPMASSQSI